MAPKPKQANKQATAQKATAARQTRKPARRTTKKSQLIGMLQASGGADIARISKKLGWQAHTTRAALTGLRKSGYLIEAQKPEGSKVSHYRITAKPQTTHAPQA